MTYLPDIISPKAYLMAETITIHFCLDSGKYIRYYSFVIMFLNVQV